MARAFRDDFWRWTARSREVIVEAFILGSKARCTDRLKAIPSSVGKSKLVAKQRAHQHRSRKILVGSGNYVFETPEHGATGPIPLSTAHPGD